MHGGKELVPPVKTRWAPERTTGRILDGDRISGRINEFAGRARRQVGEWTGDKTDQVEGLAQELRGKAQLAWCGVKDALRAIQQDTQAEENDAEMAPGETFRAAFRSQYRRGQR